MWLFTREAATGITRTAITFVYGWLITRIPGIESFVVDNGIDVAGFAVVLGGVVYTLIRQTAEKWPVVGYLLIFNQKPDYS